MKSKWGLFLVCFVAFLVGCRSTPNHQSIGSENTQSPSVSPTVQNTDSIIPSPFPTNNATLIASPNPSAKTILPQALPPDNYLIYWSYTEEILRLTSLDGAVEYTFPSVANISFFDLNIDHQEFAYQDLDGKIWIHDIYSEENASVPQPNILNGARYESGPRWSPDGNKLVYATATISIINNQPVFEEIPSLWVSYINEDRVEKVTDWPYIETDPTWAPDGRWIAFISDHENIDPTNDIVGGSTDLYIMPTTCLDNPDSCDELSQKVTNIGSSGWVGTPTWSPDSSGIAFICSSANRPQIELCVYSLLSERVNYLTELSDQTTSIDWSPIANQIIYTSDDDIYLIQSEGGSSINLTKSEEWEENGSVYWSPDGQYIAFTSNYPDNDNSGFSVIASEGKERMDYHEMIPGSEMFVSWLVIPVSIEIGDQLEITIAGKNLNLRQSPSLEGNSIRKLQPGDVIRIQDGPVDSGGYRWWNVTVENSTLSGWVAEQFQWYRHVENQ